MNNYAYININANNIDDIVSFYTVKNYERINNNIKDYINDQINYVPVDKNIILEFTGCKFENNDKQKIKDAINNYYKSIYNDKIINLNKINKELIILAIAPLLSYLILNVLQLISFIKCANELELIFIGFILWEFITLLIKEKKQLKFDKLKASQLVNAEIQFTQE